LILIHILGTDGAGKTTLAKRLAEKSNARRKTKYLYCQHRPFFLWLLKLPARLMFMRRTNPFTNYDQYKARKDAISSRRPWLTKLYARLWYFDVWLQTWPRMIWARRTADVVLLDRYYLDWVVNLGVLQRNSIESMLREARFLEGFLPRANLHIFLDVSEETAFARKTDIQSLQYLRERKERYLQLAPHYNFQIVDANQDAEGVSKQVRALVEASIATTTGAQTVASNCRDPVKDVGADVRRL
jgi:thymidylate kinase